MLRQKVTAGHRWAMLATGVLAQSSSAYFVHGTAFLLPQLLNEGFTLGAAGVLVAMPIVGLTLTLFGWGAIVDRIGERTVLAAGQAILALSALAAALSPNYVVLGLFLVTGGIGAASSNAASGRVVVGWFRVDQRGLAMGIRQSAQPLGVAIAALGLPLVAHAFGIGAALAVPAAIAGLACLACLVVIIDPPRPARTGAEGVALLRNPYFSSNFLTRIHLVSMLLAAPQMTVWTFALVWLTHSRGWSIAAAGALVTCSQLLGAAGRIAAGVWSDRLGSRLRPLRYIAVVAAGTMALLAVLDVVDTPVAVAVLVIASVVTVADNGLAFTAIAELAGPFWSGRSLGIQNTGQNLTAAAIPPAFGVLITVAGFPAAFALAALMAAAAVPLVPTIEAQPKSDDY